MLLLQSFEELLVLLVEIQYIDEGDRIYISLYLSVNHNHWRRLAERKGRHIEDVGHYALGSTAGCLGLTTMSLKMDSTSNPVMSKLPNPLICLC